VRLVRAALHSHSEALLHRHKHHTSQRLEYPMASDRTALLESSGMPLIGTISLLYFDVSFPVSRLKPENWTVAPSTLSISEPTRPAAKPAACRMPLLHSAFAQSNLGCHMLLDTEHTTPSSSSLT
jgi:hypothetical protein